MTGLISPAEAAQLLSVSRSSIYRMMNDGSLSSVKIRRARRIPLSDIEALTRAPELPNAGTGTPSSLQL